MILVSILLSFLPAIAYCFVIYWIDRYEKEPRRLIWGTFLWGAIVAAGASYILNTFVGVSVYQFTSSLSTAQNAIGTYAAPVVEESFKAFAILIIFVIRRDEFDTIIDGLVYAGIAAMGFAATENVLYLYNRGFLLNGWEGLWIQFVLRVIFGAWNHSFYTAFTGIGLAVARLNTKRAVRYLAPLGGWLLAITTHFLHNSLHNAAVGFDNLMLVIMVDWLGWIAMGGLIIWALKREKGWIVEEIQEEVENGTVSEEQFSVLTNTWFRQKAGIASLFSLKENDTNRLYRMCTELAYKKQQFDLVGETKANSLEIIEELRLEVGKLSKAVAALQSSEAAALESG